MSKEINYHIQNVGRVKSAGVPLDVLEHAAAGFIENRGPDTATETMDNFRQLRKAPPEEVRDRFFPRDSKHKYLFRSSHLLTHPILKTDQGSGKFLIFETGTDPDQLAVYQIAVETGYMIAETHLLNQLNEKGNPKQVLDSYEEVEHLFMKLDLKEAQLAYERFIQICQDHGIAAIREAGVGREGAFFIRPASAGDPIVIPARIAEKVSNDTQLAMNSLIDKALYNKKRFAEDNNIKLIDPYVHPALYFQADYQINLDGSVTLDRFQLPDVGLFLTQLASRKNNILEKISSKMSSAKDAVIDTIELELSSRLNSEKPIYLITRDEVLEKAEDVLENLEYLCLQNELGNRGIVTTPLKMSNIDQLKSGDVGILLNVDSQSPGFQFFLQGYLESQSTIYPDPFLKFVAENETGYVKIVLNQRDISRLKTIVGEVEQSSPKVYMQLMALDYELLRLGIKDNVFHIHMSSHKTPIGCYRYDVRGIMMALNEISEFDDVYIRSIPVNSRKEILNQFENRSLYSVFRFMFTKGGRL